MTDGISHGLSDGMTASSGGHRRSPVPVVLASASSARRATLAAAGVDARVAVSSVDEEDTVRRGQQRYDDLSSADIALLLARAKCEDVAAQIESDDPPAGMDADCLVLGCDSVLELDGRVHGKPGSPDVALARWRSMRGSQGVLHTGHWLIDVRAPEAGGTGATLGAVASTAVWFANIPDDELEAYVDTGEPLNVAGAFTIDGLGGPFVDRLEGDPHNVVGVSLPVVRELLLELGLRWYDVRTR